MTTLGNLIQQHAASDAANSNWEAVALVLNSKTISKTSAGTLTSMAKTLSALAVNEREPTLQAFATTHVGQDGRTKLATVGLDFAHPITVGLINSLSAQMPPGVPAKLLALGNWTVSPAENAGLPAVTAGQCQTAWTEFQAEQLLVQQVAKRAACRAAIGSINPESIIPDSGAVPSIDSVIASIRNVLESFGAWE